MKRSSLKYVIGGVLVIAIAVWIFGSISSKNLTYYYTPSEIPSKFDTIKGQTIRVMGLVKNQSVTWIPKETKLQFQITDELNHVIRVDYTGAKPDMFKEGQGVVVEGRLTDQDSFAATTLLVKHNEEYKTSDHKEQKEDYYQSLQP